MNGQEIVDLIGGAVWLLAVEIRQAKEELMATLDEAVTRITTDISNAVGALADLRAQIAALGNQGADVDALNASAQQLEDALNNAGTTAGQVTNPDGTAPGTTPDQPPADQPPTDENPPS